RRIERAAALVRLALVNEREELQHGTWCETKALVRIEPEDRAREAHVERDLASVAPFERFGLHRCAATWALHDQPSDLPHSGQNRVRPARVDLQCGHVAPAAGDGGLPAAPVSTGRLAAAFPNAFAISRPIASPAPSPAPAPAAPPLCAAATGIERAV